MMSGVVFGAVAPCRECGGAGQVKHRADPAAARERERRKRHGEPVDPPPSMDTCPRCAGAGILPAGEADRVGPPDELPF